MTRGFEIYALDHLVLTVASIEQSCSFYQDALGMEVVHFGKGRTALRFGDQKINLHLAGHELEPKSAHPTPGSADVCLLTRTPLKSVVAHLESCGIELETEFVRRTGARHPLLSVYLRDPDQNLIEISNEHRT